MTAVRLRQPQMFVEMSPAVLGHDAEVALRDRIDPSLGARAFQSSPKRYAWDTDATGRDGNVFWSMVLNPWNPLEGNETRIPTLAGEVLRFMPQSGQDWPLNNPPIAWPTESRPSIQPDAPAYPRCETLTWAGLSILEQAHRQITSFEWRADNKPFVPRRLRKVVVTYPSGWTASEVDAYRAKWQKAVNIFRFGHLPKPTESGPELVIDLDEAVASQLPIIYSEMRRLGAIGDNWLELISNRGGASSNARVMTIDIGGGTTDISVVDYRDDAPGPGISLHAELLFKDSSTQAGDAVVKSVIERVLLPTIGATIRHDPQRWDRFVSLFGAPHQSHTEKVEWSKITRLVFVPIVRRWLADRIEGLDGNPTTQNAWTPRDAGVEEADAMLLNRKLGEAGVGDLFSVDEPLPPLPDYDAVDGCIRDTFRHLFRSLAKHVAAFEADLVIVTGKPSELPAVRELLTYHLPLPLDRLIFAKDFDAGDWYPLYDRRIEDAKTVTAVGAALYLAIINGRMPNWHVQLSRTGHDLTCARNWWGSIHSHEGIGIDSTEFAKVIMTPQEDTITVDMMVGTVIGRKRLRVGSAPDPVYIFRWADPDRRAGSHGPVSVMLSITLQRVTPTQPGAGESLRISSVSGRHNGGQVSSNDVELKLCTLAEGEFWQDTGRFMVADSLH